ncbi:MAG: hypothetical protein ACK501_20635 [Planctomycetota bacterium]|jgi:hypothetical protein
MRHHSVAFIAAPRRCTIGTGFGGGFPAAKVGCAHPNAYPMLIHPLLLWPAGGVASAVLAGFMAVVSGIAAGTPPATASSEVTVEARASTAFTGPTNGSISFKAHCPLGVFDRAITACVTVTKPGKKPLVNGVPAADQVDGRKEFPRSTTMPSIASDYGTLLSNNGWVSGVDYLVSGSSIHFYGITELDFGSSHQHLEVTASLDTGTPTKVTITRTAPLAGGTIHLKGFGHRIDSDGQLETAMTPIACVFKEGDSAAQIVARLAKTLDRNGWSHQLTGSSNQIVIVANGKAFPIDSLQIEVAYADVGADKNGDHWVLGGVQ